MSNTIPCITAFLIGFLGSLHCLGMCSGIVWMLSANINKKTKQSFYLYQIYYNTGRLLSYTFMGFIASFLGIIVSDLFNNNIIYCLQIFSGALLINIGLYINSTFQFLKHIELIGLKFWSLLSPYIKKIIPVRTPFQGIMLGIFWGNMPCGLTYSVLIWTLTFNSIYKSAFLMTFFGLGTLPAMLVTGAAASHLQKLKQNKKVRFAASLIIIIFGCWTVVHTIIK